MRPATSIDNRVIGDVIRMSNQQIRLHEPHSEAQKTCASERLLRSAGTSIVINYETEILISCLLR